MTDGIDFLLNEYDSLKEEIRLRQSQIVEIEKGSILLLTGIYSFAFSKLTTPPNALKEILCAIAPLVVFIALVKIGQNVSRILDISEYIKRIEIYFRDLPAEAGRIPKNLGYENYLRPKALSESNFQKLFGDFFARKAEIFFFVVILVVSVVLLALVYKGWF